MVVFTGVTCRWAVFMLRNGLGEVVSHLRLYARMELNLTVFMVLLEIFIHHQKL